MRDPLFSEHQRTSAAKPQREPLEAWCVLDGHSGVIMYVTRNRATVNASALPGDRIIHLREVVEEEE